MLYKINNKSYVKVGSKYFEVKFELDKNDKVSIKPTDKYVTIESVDEITSYDFDSAKDEIKKSLTVKIKPIIKESMAKNDRG